MSSPGAGSSSSADLPTGTRIGDFRLDRVIGRGSRATVYEAMQLSLERRVAFKLVHDRELAERVQRLRWPEHPAAVSLFATGNSEHGPWLAMRLLPGATLATRRAPLQPVAAALEAAHAAGLVHGDVTARNVLVADGRAFLTDFGLGSVAATADEDRTAFDRLLNEHPAPEPLRRRGAFGAAVAAALVVAVVGVVLASSDRSGEADGAPPPVPAGTRPVGSDLAPGGVESVDCDGRPVTGGSAACTISQRSLAGHRTAVPADGTITSWAVRGARGVLALQVLRGRGGRLIEIARSGDARIPGPGVQRITADLVVSAGDRVGLLVSPDAVVGIRRGGSLATIERWFGPLLQPARPPERPAGTGLDHELLLRVDVRPRGRAGGSAGRRLASREVDVAGGSTRRAVVVTTERAVLLEVFDRTLLLARARIRGANARGRLQEVIATAGAVHVRWRNPDGGEVQRTFSVGPDGFS